MKLLLLSATSPEIKPVIELFGFREGNNYYRGHQISVVTGGVGMVATAYALGRQFASARFDLAVQAGIAGSFTRDIDLGETLVVESDYFSEFGAEDGDLFLPAHAMGLGLNNQFSVDCATTLKMGAGFRKVRAITVNTVHGNDDSIQKIRKYFNPHLESMEGAAFFYACGVEDIPCVQLRSVSNYVERRNRENWNIPLAVANLNRSLTEMLKSIL